MLSLVDGRGKCDGDGGADDDHREQLTDHPTPKSVAHRHEHLANFRTLICRCELDRQADVAFGIGGYVYSDRCDENHAHETLEDAPQNGRCAACDAGYAGQKFCRAGAARGAWGLRNSCTRPARCHTPPGRCLRRLVRR